MPWLPGEVHAFLVDLKARETYSSSVLGATVATGEKKTEKRKKFILRSYGASWSKGHQRPRRSLASRLSTHDVPGAVAAGLVGSAAMGVFGVVSFGSPEDGSILGRWAYWVSGVAT